MPRTSGQQYFGEALSTGGDEAEVTIAIGERTYKGTWVVSRPPPATGISLRRHRSAAYGRGVGTSRVGGPGRRRRGEGAAARRRRQRPALRLQGRLAPAPAAAPARTTRAWCTTCRSGRSSVREAHAYRTAATHRRAVARRSAHYPTPIARCDEQLTALLEERARLLARLASAGRGPGLRPGRTMDQRRRLPCRITCTTPSSRCKGGKFYSLPALGKALNVKIERLPVSIRIVLESVLRNCDGKKVTEEHVQAARQLEAERDAHRRDPLRAGAHRAAGLHRRAAAVRPRRDARRGAEDGQGPQGDRAAGAGGPGGRPLGADRPLRHQERARPQHEAGVQAQRGALPVHEVGHAGLRHLQGRAAGHRHRAPGEPGVPGARRAQVEGRRLLPRHAGRHRQPHHHDQRHRRGRLGRGRHRGRGRHARPAGVLPHAGRGRREPEGQAAPGVHRHRPRADRHRDAAQGEGGRQVRRVLRRRHARRSSVTDRATIANMAPEYGATMGFFPVDEKTIAYFKGTGRTDAEIDAFAAYFKAQGMFGMPKAGDDRLQPDAGARPLDASCRRSPARSARRTASTSTR